MDYQLFYYEDIQLPAEARWFLWQWERYTGLHTPIDATVNDLLARLKMPLRQGQKTLLELKKAGVVEAIPVAKGRGRPSYRYSVASTLLATLKALPNEEPPLSDLIEYISQYEPLTVSVSTKAPSQDVEKAKASLQGPSENDKEQKKLPLSVREPNLNHSHRRKKQLTRANRWVVMVLLAHSEVPGIVTDLSHITLQRLTGMSTSQLAGQLKKLKKFGVIAYHQPGQAGKLLGKRMTSIYSLNLAHPLLGKPEINAVSLYFPTPSENLATELNHGLIDALMVYGVCLKYKEILIENLNELNAMSAVTKWSNQAAMPAYIVNRLKAIEELGEKLTKNQETHSQAEKLLPPLRHLSSTVRVFAETCNASQTEWLRAHVHAEAMQMLSTQWLYLWDDDDPLPNTPDAQVDPDAALRHQLAHHLAKNFHRQLRQHAEKHHDIEFDALNYTLTPIHDHDGDRLRGWALRCFALRTNGVGYLPDVIVNGTSILFSLRRHWQTHRQKIISTQPH